MEKDFTVACLPPHPPSRRRVCLLFPSRLHDFSKVGIAHLHSSFLSSASLFIPLNIPWVSSMGLRKCACQSEQVQRSSKVCTFTETIMFNLRTYGVWSLWTLCHNQSLLYSVPSREIPTFRHLTRQCPRPFIQARPRSSVFRRPLFGLVVHRIKPCQPSVDRSLAKFLIFTP